MPSLEERDAIWRRIESEAHEQFAAELERLEETPLVFGEPIAWVECRFGRTDGLSAVHRVGFPIGDRPFTTCREVIPAPTRWMVLTPRVIRGMKPCRYCEAEYQRVTKADRGQAEHAA